jgi:hypothetical protein
VRDGRLPRRLCDRLTHAELIGVDAAPGMIRAAAGEGDLERIGPAAARAEADLDISATYRPARSCRQAPTRINL